MGWLLLIGVVLVLVGVGALFGPFGIVILVGVLIVLIAGQVMADKAREDTIWKNYERRQREWERWRTESMTDEELEEEARVAALTDEEFEREFGDEENLDGDVPAVTAHMKGDWQ